MLCFCCDSQKLEKIVAVIYFHELQQKQNTIYELKTPLHHLSTIKSKSSRKIAIAVT